MSTHNLFQKITNQTQVQPTWEIAPQATVRLIHQFTLDQAENSCHITFRIGAGALLEYILFVMPGANISLSLDFIIEEQASAFIDGAYLLRNTQHAQIRTRQIHHGSSSRSSVVINGVVTDSALLDFKGLIEIQADATQSVAVLENKTILWSDQARAISVPSLEVHTNDVQCAHGTAVGPLSTHELYYLCSRGISYRHAQRLLLMSFYQKIFADRAPEHVQYMTDAVTHFLQTKDS